MRILLKPTGISHVRRLIIGQAMRVS